MQLRKEQNRTVKGRRFLLNFIKRSKIITSIAAVGIVSIISISSVAAFFADEDNVSNTLSIGNCTVEINEEFEPPDDGVEAGTEFTKKPSVINTGTVDCYVRVRADISDGQIEPYLIIDFNTDNWTDKQEDGYYYYTGNTDNNGILSPGEETEPLFTTVKVDDNIPADAIADFFDIYIYAEGVQTYGYDSASEAWLMYTPQTL